MKQQATRELISEVHFQHSIWKNELSFYIDQLNIFQERLEEIASKNTSKEVHISIEQFQNKFIIQRREINKLIDLISKNEEKAAKYGQLHLKRVDYVATEEYRGLEKEIGVFEKLYKELKTSFYDFLAKWM